MVTPLLDDVSDKTISLEYQQRVDVGAYVGDSEHSAGLLGYAIALMQLNIVFELLSFCQCSKLTVISSRQTRAAEHSTNNLVI